LLFVSKDAIFQPPKAIRFGHCGQLAVYSIACNQQPA